MKSTTQFLLALMLLGLTSLACSIESFIPADTSTTTENNVVFQDDFSDPSSGWSTLNEENKWIGYADGKFRFLVNDAKFDYWSTPGLKFTDVRIDVDATKNAGPDDNDFGVICRYQDENNFYGMLISSDGYYGISKMKDGVHNVLGSDGMEVSDAIKTGANSNHLMAECIGSTLRLTVNGQKVFEVEDTDFQSGDVGLVAGTFDQPGVDVSFDNFIVTKP